MENKEVITGDSSLAAAILPQLDAFPAQNLGLRCGMSKVEYENLICHLLQMMEKMNVGRRTQARARLYVDKFLLKNHGSEINEVLAFGYAAMFLAIENSESNHVEIIESIQQNIKEHQPNTLNLYKNLIAKALEGKFELDTIFCFLNLLVKTGFDSSNGLMETFQTILQFSNTQYELIGVPSKIVFFSCLSYMLQGHHDSLMAEFDLRIVEQGYRQEIGRVRTILCQALDD